MRKISPLFLVLAVAIVIVLAFVFLSTKPHPIEKKAEQKVKSQELRRFEPKEEVVDDSLDFESAQAFLSEGQPKGALKLVAKYRSEMEQDTLVGKRWMDLFVRASAEAKDTAQLAIIFDYRPEVFKHHEKGSLVLAEAFVVSGETEKYDQLRDLWQGHERHAADWLILDSDKNVLEGNRAEAVRLLQSKRFDGKQEVSRLSRLALLHVNDEPKTAWAYLKEAHDKDPKNTATLSYRARLLESVGKDGLALSEYLAATQVDPDNTNLQNQLAEFYLRHHRYVQALDVWKGILGQDADDKVWLSALFWNRVAKPMDFDWRGHTIPNKPLKPLIEYIVNLKPWEYWDNQKFEQLSDAKKLLATQQSTWWLRLLSNLKLGKEEEALQLLNENPFEERSWNPNLEYTLKQIIAYRKSGTLNLEGMPEGLSEQETGLFGELHRFKGNTTGAISNDLATLLKSPAAFSAALMAAGWYEAAIELQPMKVLPSTIPSWVSTDFTHALRQNRGDGEALAFAAAQQQTPQLQLLVAELMIAEGSGDEGLALLKKLSSTRGDVGMRATWLISLIHFDNEDFDTAKRLVNNHSELSRHPLGKETLARIALKEGNNRLADELYGSIEEESTEAKSYLARKAFAEKNWHRARELLVELLKEYPNNELLRSNIRIVDEEERKLDVVNL